MWTAPRVACAGPRGDSSALPLQLQSPTKNDSCPSSGAGACETAGRAARRPSRTPATVPLTFNVTASATTSDSGASVTGWHIYVDSVDKFGTPGPTSSINTNVTTTAGTHTVLVRAWDSTGVFGDQTLTVTATATQGV